MKAVLRILKILGVFFACLFAISLVWYFIESVNSSGNEANSVIDYVLYLIGYGDLDMDDHYSLTVFSIISLFTLTLMSSVFTVSLFELRSKARLLPMIKISEENGEYTACAEIKTIGKDIYDVTAVLIAKIGEEIHSENLYFPYVPKKSVQRIKLSFDVGSPLYKYMRSSLEGNNETAPLIITLAYTDIEGGQEYKSCAKFNYSRENGDFGYSHKELHDILIDDYLLREEFPVDITKANAINDEDISISFEKANAMRAVVDMTSHKDYELKSFVMACLSDFEDNDWRKFADLGYHLDLEYQVKGRMTVTLEFKYGDKNLKVYRQSLHPEGEFKHFSLALNSEVVNYEELSNIRELCFTVFYEDTDLEAHSGEFVIQNCALRL